MLSDGDAALSAHFRVLDEKLRSRDLIDFASEAHFLEEMMKWPEILQKLDRSIADAEEKQKMVKEWVGYLNHLAYDMEDMLDELSTEYRRPKVSQAGNTSRIQKLIPSCCTRSDLQANFDLRSRVREITARLDSTLLEKMRMFNLVEHRTTSSSDMQPPRETTSLVDEGTTSSSHMLLPRETTSLVGEGTTSSSYMQLQRGATSLVDEGAVYGVDQRKKVDQKKGAVYGRELDKSKILQLLKEPSDPNVGVIAIVGMGGIGKTTLAQLVYDDPLTYEHFQLKIWVCVSVDFDLMRTTKSLLEQSTFQRVDSKELEKLQQQLNQVLAGKRFLIVLDDVWSQIYADLDALLRPLMNGAPGSKIIVTTRSINVANMMGAVAMYQLNRLSEEECWMVLARTAFQGESMTVNPELEMIGREIVKKRCGGSPLAAKVLGGILRGNERKSAWLAVLKDEVRSDAFESDDLPALELSDEVRSDAVESDDLPALELSDEVRSDAFESDVLLPALKLSYDVLPSHLKRCFAYCAILPQRLELDKEKIVLLWMAEGLIPQTNDERRMEEVGTDLVDDLLARSLFQASSADKTRFIMYDLANNLAQKIAGDACFKLEDEVYVGEESKLKEVRHSSYEQRDLDGIKRFAPFYKMERLRTFLPFLRRSYPVCYLPSCVPGQLLERLKYLRVLSFSHYNIKKLPDSIGNLKHLRYVDLSYTPIEVLPESITSLCNLQTLILEDCENLRKLPARMDNLINLCHLNIKGTHLTEGMPLGIKELSSLRMLTNFVMGKGCLKIDLMKLKSLCGELCISNLDFAKSAEDAREARLMEKEGITNLELRWSTDIYTQDEELLQHDVLAELKPHSNLEKLTLEGYAGARFPTWVGDSTLNNLVHLKLEGCKRCTSLPQLGGLTNLKELFILEMSSLQKIDQQFYGTDCSTPFQSLEVLCFRYLDDWEMWNDCEVAFEKLRELCIGNCGKLSGELPSHLPSLQVLVVNDCENLVASLSSLPKLRALEIRNCKKVDFILKDDFGSLNMIVLSNISIISNLAAGFLQRLKEFKNLTMSRISNFTMTVPSSMRQYGGVVTNLECVFQRLPQLVSIVEEKDTELQMELGSSKIETVTLRECEKLPAWIQRLEFLRELTIEKCQTLETFPGGLPSRLRVLTVIDCRLFGAFSDLMVCNRQSLQVLEICGCDFLISLGRGQLPPTLKNLSIVDCKNLKCLFEVGERGSSSFSTNIEDLMIKGCDNLTSISTALEGELLSKLQCLEISNCKILKSLGERFDGNIPLKFVYIIDCGSLESLPEGLDNLAELQEFEISGCQSIVSFPEGGLPTNSLEILEIKDLKNLKALPVNLHTLSSLQELYISDCTSLVPFPRECLPPNLNTFTVKNVRNCEVMSDWGLDHLNSLLKLDIDGGCTESASFPPDEARGKLPQSLTHLAIRDFPNLERFSAGFQGLTSLKHLTLQNCPKLASFPENGMLDNLLQLDVRSCSMLKQKWQEGKEQPWWYKISEIPKFEI